MVKVAANRPDVRVLKDALTHASEQPHAVVAANRPDVRVLKGLIKVDTPPARKVAANRPDVRVLKVHSYPNRNRTISRLQRTDPM